MSLIGQPLVEWEKRAILFTLIHCQLKRKETAKVLKITMPTLRQKIKKYEIESLITQHLLSLLEGISAEVPK